VARALNLAYHNGMRAVLFDLFGTLVPNVPPPIHAAAMREMAAALDLEPEAFEAAWKARFQERMDGRLRDGDSQFLPILESLGKTADAERLQAATAARRTYIRAMLQPKSDAVAVLQALRDRGFELALVSDCSSETPELLDETPLGPFFPIRAASAILGHRKPHEIMYRHALNGLGVRGEQCWYVGDGNSHELVGARRHGMRTVWVDNGDEQHWKIEFSSEADHTINRLEELLGLVGN